MELSARFIFRPPEIPQFKLLVPHNPIYISLSQQLPFAPKPLSKPSLSSISRTPLTVTAYRKLPIEGISDELNAVASQNLDFVYTRRRVRAAFTEVQDQLDHCLFKRAPTGIRTMEWYERNSRDLEIFCKRWIPGPDVPTKGALFFCHGYGDTCTFFFEGVAKRIAASGYAVYAMDYPGFGLSEGLHGYIPNFDDIVDDVIEQYTKIKERPELRGLPQYILGQSMGGAVTLKVHFKEPEAWDGLVLVAPMCKIAEELTPPAVAQKALSLLSKVVPKLKIFPRQDLAELGFREPTKRKMAAYNVICYEDQMRLGTAMQLLKAVNDVECQLDRVTAPLLIVHGAADKITDPLVSQFLYEKASSKDKTLKLYEGGYHSILEGEPDERILTILDDIISWLDTRSIIN